LTIKEKGSDAHLPKGWEQRIRDMLDAQRRRLDAEQARVEAIRLGKRARSGG
jgi:hypothetical protein